MSLIKVISREKLLFQNKSYRCAVGENGFSSSKKEGDKATPSGTFQLRKCWYRSDRVQKPDTTLPIRVITPEDGWCDDAGHACYNRPVKLPFSGSHEKLWREDHAYDVVVPIGFNDDPAAPGKGSAIFLHLATPDYTPTLGCIALSLRDILEIVKTATAIEIKAA